MSTKPTANAAPVHPDGYPIPLPMFGWAVALDNGVHYVDCVTAKRADAWTRFEEVLQDTDGDEWIGVTTFRRYWMSKGFRVRRVRSVVVG